MLLSKLYNNITYNYKKFDKKNHLIKLSFNNNVYYNKFTKDLSAYNILFNN